MYELATDRRRGFYAGLLKALLRALSLVYGLSVRFCAWQQGMACRRMECRVVSVGNITLGGTGKTSLVEYVARFLKSAGLRVAVVSRGYLRPVAAGDSVAAMGDEPALLLRKLGGVPIIVDKDRQRACRRACHEYGADAVVLDDGFQQWRIKKDLEIVAIDALDPFGNRALLPRGILREPLSSLGRADVFVLTKTDLGEGTADLEVFLRKVNPSALIVRSVHAPLGVWEYPEPAALVSLETLRGRGVALFSGIGDPGSFEKIVLRAGIRVSAHFRFGDHHPFSRDDLDAVARKAMQAGAQALMTTEKDAVRVSASLPEGFRDEGLPLFVLRIELKIVENEEGFRDRLRRVSRR